MQAFACEVCGLLVTFESDACLRCSSQLGFVAETGRLRALLSLGEGWARCEEHLALGCNWVVPTDGDHERCRACRLNRTIEGGDDLAGRLAQLATGAAQRRLAYQLLALELPLSPRTDDPRWGLAFDLLYRPGGKVITGHATGVVTIDLVEGDDSHREKVRRRLGEPYRTVLGHLRHEVGHYYWHLLRRSPETIEAARLLFGDERSDYRAALDRHYADGAPAAWQDGHVSAYATAHPYEDWAETFAHYLHITDSLETAAAFGVLVLGPDGVPGLQDGTSTTSVPQAVHLASSGIGDIVEQWVALAYALNAMNRSMGKDDLYPFVLSPTVIDKLGFVHDTVQHWPAAAAGD